jgi:hypothetical protein
MVGVAFSVLSKDSFLIKNILIFVIDGLNGFNEVTKASLS